jgi:hypothetical protein
MADQSEEKPAPRDRRILKHIENLFRSGYDLDAYAAALQKVRLDAQLTKPKKVAIYKTLAQSSAQAYLSAITGRPINIDPVFEAMLSPDDYQEYVKSKPELPAGVKPIDPFSNEPEEIDLEAEVKPKPHEVE